MLQWLREQRRLHLLAQPFPETWDSFLFRDVAHYPLLSEDQRALLRDNMRILVAEKYWEGCGGLQVTEEMKVTIAAQACLLLLGSDNEFFSRVLSILVYPSVFTIPGEWSGEDETRGVFSGQAVYRGPAILAWEQVIAEGRNPAEGHNVVIHEFAHHLDYLDGYINGTPDLSDPELAEQWGPVMTADYRRLVRDVRKGRATFLGSYAAHNEAEFFAVASERFFTLPWQLRHYHRRLYEVLAEFYSVEPTEWFAGCRETPFGPSIVPKPSLGQ